MIDIKAYFDRSSDTVDGKFTIIESGVTVFKQVHTRSGQRGYTKTNWIRNKSPIPYGEHWLWLRPLNPGAAPGATGIGEFYNISSNTNDVLTIVGGPGEVRRAIGLHAENKYPGSAGCIVVVSLNQFASLSKYFAHLRNDLKLTRIRLVVT